MNKNCKILLSVAIFFTLFSCNVTLVLAKEVCQIDASDDRDENAYETFEEALDDDCDELIVQKGEYDEDLNIDNEIIITGESKEDVVLRGSLTLKNQAKLSTFTFKDASITIKTDDNVILDNLIVQDADEGVFAKKDTKVEIKNSSFYDNKKAIVVDDDAQINLTNSQIYNNDQGVSLSSGVSGIISDNVVRNNQTGIEFFIDAYVSIMNNTIKSNTESAIVAKYRKNVVPTLSTKIKGNTLINNAKFALDCRILSGTVSEKLWTNSIEFVDNDMYLNGEENISKNCSFDEEKLMSAKSKAIEQHKKEIENKKEKKAQEIMETLKKKKKKKEFERREIKNNQDNLRNALQQDRNKQQIIIDLKEEQKRLYENDLNQEEMVKKRSKIAIFFVGPNYKVLKEMAKNLSMYKKNINEAKRNHRDINDERIAEQSLSDILIMQKQEEEIYNFIKNYNNKFSLFGWFFKTKA